MALITIAGFPSSGKSARAQQIQVALETRLKEDNGPILRVVVVSDHSLDILPTAYDDSALEKPARGTLFAAVQRFLATDTILILDSLNYIKGFRYQLYCAAREMKLRTCTVRRYSQPLGLHEHPHPGICRCPSRPLSTVEFPSRERLLTPDASRSHFPPFQSLSSTCTVWITSWSDLKNRHPWFVGIRLFSLWLGTTHRFQIRKYGMR